jgi:hypothetical protein
MNAIGVHKSVALIRGFDVARDQLAETKAVEVVTLLKSKTIFLRSLLSSPRTVSRRDGAEAPKVKRLATSNIVAFVASRTLIVKLMIEPGFFPVLACWVLWPVS